MTFFTKPKVHDKHMLVRASSTLINALSYVAKQRQTTRTQIIRDLCIDYLDKFEQEHGLIDQTGWRIAMAKDSQESVHDDS
jgi:metal-responsive CopG/Arc/MetJ family transcriptional regulator